MSICIFLHFILLFPPAVGDSSATTLFSPLFQKILNLHFYCHVRVVAESKKFRWCQTWSSPTFGTIFMSTLLLNIIECQIVSHNSQYMNLTGSFQAAGFAICYLIFVAFWVASGRRTISITSFLICKKRESLYPSVPLLTLLICQSILRENNPNKMGITELITIPPPNNNRVL